MSQCTGNKFDKGFVVHSLCYYSLYGVSRFTNQLFHSAQHADQLTCLLSSLWARFNKEKFSSGLEGAL